MERIIKKNTEDLNRALAAWIAELIKNTLKEKPLFTFVLAGGGTPAALYRQLASPVFRSEIDWARMMIFWGDERCVPFSDPDNNARMAFENLLSLVPVPEKNIFRINTHLAPSSAATDYENKLRRIFPGNEPGFDLVLLGLGDNAHTLSLFPGYDMSGEKGHWVRAVYVKELESYRITLTANAVNAAEQIVFLVSGAKKAKAVRQVLEGNENTALYPAQLIRPRSGKLYWWLDLAAAEELTK